MPGIGETSQFNLLLVEVDLLVVKSGNAGPDLRGSLAEPGLLVGVETFLGAGGTLGTVEALKATAQAGVAEGTVAAAVAWQLVDHAGDLCHLLVHVDLPRILEVFAGELRSRQDWRQGADFERGGGMIGGDIVVPDWTTARSLLP